tara:strand:+ start:1269 stop:3440 length:2172 start_codon:yes stop_codon:yes gene_type:complete
MSLNKVLNRPLFRKEALKKGALKPIKAKIGQMIGPPTVNVTGQMQRNFPVAINQQGFFGRNIRPAMQRTGRFLKSSFGLRPLISSTGTYMLSDDILTKLGVTGPLKTGINLAAGIAGATPYGRGIGYAYSGLKGLSALADKIRRDNPQSFIGLNEGQNTFDQITGGVLGGEPLLTGDRAINPFRKLDTTKETRKQRRDRKKLEVAAREEGSEGQIGTDQLTQPDELAQPQNETEIGGKKVVDLDKTIQGDRIPNVNMVGDPAQFYKDDPFLTSKPEAPVEEPKKDLPKKEDTLTTQANTKRNALSQQLELAKQIQAEMMEGRPSNARTIFLTNLATGLLTGTTRKKGLGGALEVFGQALGPAVNNSVMIKMKEDELNDRLLERAMDFSINYLKAQNDGLKLPDTKDIGVVQYTNKNGVVINRPGRVLKDGTKQIATGRIVNGISEYQTVPATTTFIKNDDANKETLEIAGDLGGKYGALKLINRSLGIIERGDADAGVVGLFGLYSGRLTDAIGDIFDYGKETNVEAGRTEFNIEKRKAAVRLVNSGEFKDITEAERYLNKQLGANFDSIYKKNLAQIKKRIKDGKKLDYERLAINETVLVYRLANSLKSKDRLTQKDIQMAKELVKVFPAFRGEASVISSLIAVSETIMDDIKEKENLYLQAGGGTEFLVNSRIDAGLIPAQGADFDNLTPFVFQQLEQRKKSVGAKSQEELKKILEGVPTK